MKKATTIEEQIIIMQNRGILITDINKAKEILSDIGYYRLGFYCFPFEKTYPILKDRNHLYKEGTKFEDIIELYYLDYNLRNILLKYINRVEINLRTKIIYTISNKYINNPIWFSDKSIMKDNFVDKFDIDIYNSKFRLNKVINQHHAKYSKHRYAPSWKTMEYFTFGNLYKTLIHFKDSNDCLEIAHCYDMKSLKIFKNYIHTIIQIRNKCAHGNTLYDFNSDQGIISGPALQIDAMNRNKLYSAICVIKFILSKISINRSNDMMKEIDDLFNKYKHNIVIQELIEKVIK